MFGTLAIPNQERMTIIVCMGEVRSILRCVPTHRAGWKNRCRLREEGGPLLRGHWPTIWQGVLGQRTEIQNTALETLTAFYRALSRRWGRRIQTPNYLARGARTYGWLTGIRHNFLSTLLILRACSKLKFETSLPELFGRNSP